ncbi:MAG TPA: hypothetical protein VHP81_10000 [Lachnospiraceae bacterium]|nr:hypothetical protein [Lachnospiraceae bacterium]
MLVNYFFGFRLKEVISDVLSKQMNNGMSFEEFTSAGGVGYHMAQVSWAIGAIAAIPISLVLLLLFMLVSKLWYKKRVQNDEKILEKESILEKRNAEIQTYNQKIMQQIDVLEKKKSELLFLLRENAPWYPESHFFIEAVDFIIEVMNSNRAQTIEQALSLYEINVARQ